MLDLLFIVVNLIPLPFWFLMIFLPRRQFTRRVMANYMVFLVLGALYVFTMVGAIVAGVDAAARAALALTSISRQRQDWRRHLIVLRRRSWCGYTWSQWI